MTPGTWALVPAKAYARAKTRLAPRLEASERAATARRLLVATLGVLGARSDLAGVLVVTDGDDVAADARERGVEVLRDRGEGLGPAVEAGLAHLGAQQASAALVLMPDLPRLAAADLDALLDAEAAIVAAPNLAGVGTNALRVPLPPPFPTCFGRPDGWRAHLDAARAAGLAVAVVERPGLGLDLDTPEDLTR